MLFRLSSQGHMFPEGVVAVAIRSAENLAAKERGRDLWRAVGCKVGFG